MGTFEELGLSFQTVSSILGLFIAAAVIAAFIHIALLTLKAAAICDISYFLGFKNPWYAFVPVLSGYAFGRLATEDERSDRNTSPLGVLLAILDLVFILLCVVVIAMALMGAVELIFDADKALAEGRDISAKSFDILSKAVFPLFLTGVVAVVRKIIYTVCTYKVFMTIARGRAVVFTVLSFIIPVLLPFFLYASRGGKIYTYDDDNLISGFDIAE